MNLVTSIARNAPFDVEAVRRDFPILARVVHERPGRPGKPLVYLDSGASAQKPHAVIDAMTQFMESDYSNVHRGVHFLSQTATDAYEAVRDVAARFLNAAHREEIVFTRNSTSAINLVASGFGHALLQPGDEVVISYMEHHANIVPWQLLRDRIGIAVKVVPVDDIGQLDMDAYAALLGPKTKLVAITHASNVLGTITPAADITRLAHERGGIPVLFDGSQAAVHGPVDVQAIGADFYVFTGHKLYGPTGIGVLYGKRDWLGRLPPYEGGGDMIASVSFEKTTYKEPPERFEAGTPPIVEAVGLGAAIDYVTGLGWEGIQAHEQALLAYATERLLAISGLRILGTAPRKVGIVSFVVDGLHPYDMASLIDRAGIAIRVGHHCAEPLAARFGVTASARASFGLYNTKGEIDALVEAVEAARAFVAR